MWVFSFPGLQRMQSPKRYVDERERGGRSVEEERIVVPPDRSVKVRELRREEVLTGTGRQFGGLLSSSASRFAHVGKASQAGLVGSMASSHTYNVYSDPTQQVVQCFRTALVLLEQIAPALLRLAVFSAAG